MNPSFGELSRDILMSGLGVIAEKINKVIIMWLFILFGKCAVKTKHIVSVPNFMGFPFNFLKGFLERMLQII